MEYLTIAIGICWFLIQFIQGWYSHSSINSEKMHKSEWTILWSGWESQEKISLKNLTQENLENSELKGLKKILFPFEKFYPKKKIKILESSKTWSVNKKDFLFKKFPKSFFEHFRDPNISTIYWERRKGKLILQISSCSYEKKTLKPNKATDMQFLAQYLENSSLLYPTECS